MRNKFRFLFVFVPILFVSGAALATMGLWNWLMPSLFGFGTLTFVKAIGVFLLVRLLFGARGWGGWRHRRLAYAGYHHSHHHAEWKQRMNDKWQNMSPEQRERFSARCGRWMGFDKDKTDTTQQ